MDFPLKSVGPEQFAGDFLPEFGCCDLQFAVHGWHPCTSQKMGRISYGRLAS
jgi:hypothetical protein